MPPAPGCTRRCFGRSMPVTLDRARDLAAVAPDCAGEWRGAMRPAYTEAVLAWRRLEAAGAGPAVAGDTPSTVYFWPDKHGTAARQLTAALHGRDPALTRSADLAAKSVGLQSLATLEVLLFSDTLPADSNGVRLPLRACHRRLPGGARRRPCPHGGQRARQRRIARRDHVPRHAGHARRADRAGSRAAVGQPIWLPPEASALALGEADCRCR